LFAPRVPHANFGIKFKSEISKYINARAIFGFGFRGEATGELQRRTPPLGSAGGIAVGAGVRTGYDHGFDRIATARCAYGAVGGSGAGGDRRTIGLALKDLN